MRFCSRFQTNNNYKMTDYDQLYSNISTILDFCIFEKNKIPFLGGKCWNVSP